MMTNRAVFLDKDGTLIPDVPYNVDVEQITLQKNILAGLAKLQAKGYKLIIISNQAGVAKGYFTEEKLAHVSDKMRDLFNANGLKLDGFYYCPHHPKGVIIGYNIDCNCRKPKPGMLLRAARDHNIDLEASWMIGDILNDVEAGNRAGCKTILVDNGNETEWIEGEYRKPTVLCKTIDDAADSVLTVDEHELARL
jgi:D-glycero-D-manno-heptose 1,7-bisphosphate phosphatase